ncbi:MAG: hypothetical protein PUB18_05395 [bacterium]|nr:hypothetical protein [bacterium]
MKIESDQIQELIQKHKKKLILPFLFLIVSIMFFLSHYIIHTKQLTEIYPFHDVIVGEEMEENILVEVEVSEIPVVFAQYSARKNTSKYYFLMDDDYMYVGYLDTDTFRTLNRTDISAHPIKIQGYTKQLSGEVIDLMIEAYNREIGYEFLTLDNYADYVGKVYLDTTKVNRSNYLLLGMGGVCFALSIIMTISYFKGSSQIRKIVYSYSAEEWKLIEQELQENVVFEKADLNFYLTDHYIIDLNSGLRIIRYSDIVWIYLYQLTQYGITTNQSIIVYTKNKKKHILLSIHSSSQKRKALLEEIISMIVEKNTKILIGYTKENRKQMKDLYQIL